MAESNISGPAIGVFALGGILVYSSAKGISVSAAIRSLVAGKDPSALRGAIAGGLGESGTLTGGLGVSAGAHAEVASDAVQYAGVPYRWGGGNPNGWDCSGFVNYVLGHDLGYVLPGGIANFNGSWHGPIAAQYYFWNKLTTVSRAEAGAGDLACWMTHMGIVVDGDHMINAYMTGFPTAVTGIESNGPKGEALRIRRLV